MLSELDLQGLSLWVLSLIVLLAFGGIAKSAGWIIESASGLARRLGISELIVGLTIVAAGTSAPEFGVTMFAAFEGHGSISVGNIVGSNIFNLGFVLGAAALFRAIPTSPPLFWRDGFVLLASSLVLFGLVGIDLKLDHRDGTLLFAMLLLYLGWLFMNRKVAPGSEEKMAALEASDEASPGLARAAFQLGGGMILLGACAHLLVGAVVAGAPRLGVSEWVIGVTVVAAGTSIPEFATALTGLAKGRYGMSAGSVIGSDIFNLLGVLGLAGMLHPVEVDVLARASLVSLCAMVLVVLVFIRSGWRISRLEGLVLLLAGLTRWILDFAMHSGRM